MTLSVAFAIFILIIVIVAGVRKRLVFELSATSILIFGSDKPGLIIYSIFSFPGTVLHELSHWLVAELLQVETGEISLLPALDTDSQKKRLGSVMTARVDPIRGFLIGVAPFVVGTLALFILESVLTTTWDAGVWWQIILVLYGMIVIGNSMLISREDRRYWPIIGIILILIIAIFSQLDLTISHSVQSWLARALTRINLVLALTLLLNIILLVAFFGVRYVLQRVTRKIVTTKRRAK